MVECNVCGWRGESFCRLFDEDDVLCPTCGSYERHRAAAAFIEQTALTKRSGRALEVGPGMVAAFRRMLEAKGWRYFSLDLWPTFGQVLGDAERLPFANASFDLVLSFHVLEHVSDDFAALSEMARVAAKDAITMLQVPYDDFRFGTIENDLPTSTILPWRYFHGHKRSYGMDFIDRCARFWPRAIEVQPLQVLSHDLAKRHGFLKNYGTTLVCGDNVQDLPGKLERQLLPLKRRWLIERRAEARWRARNGTGGDAFDDWIAAESEVAQLTADEIMSVDPWRERCSRD